MPFSDVVKGLVSKFSGGKLPDPHLSLPHFQIHDNTNLRFVARDGVKNAKSVRESVIQGYYWGASSCKRELIFQGGTKFCRFNIPPASKRLKYSKSLYSVRVGFRGTRQ